MTSYLKDNIDELFVEVKDDDEVEEQHEERRKLNTKNKEGKETW